MNKKNGFSFIELSLVLSIIAIAISLVISIYSMTVKSDEAYQGKEDIQHIVYVSHKLFNAENNSYVQLNSSVLAKSKLLSSTLVNGNFLVSKAGTISVVGFAQSFNVSYPTTDASVCIGLAVSLIGVYSQVLVGATLVNNISQVNAACTAAQHTVTIRST